MKVGVIAYHIGNNHGATLQTWALQKVLKDYGLDTGVIHYHPDGIDRLYDPMMNKKGILRQLKKFRLFITKNNSLIQYNKSQTFLKNNMNLLGGFNTYEELNTVGLDLDAYIVGSDQIWNVDRAGGFDPAYLLDFVQTGKKKIAYAASFGDKYMDPKYRENFHNSLQTFTGVSVSERSTVNAVQELTENSVQVVLDPTMLLQKKDYEEIKVKSSLKEKYILVYMIEMNDQMIELANKLSVELGIPCIQRRPLNGLDNELPPLYMEDSGEFLGLIEAAEYVITNSFYGTVFSILYGKPFVSMVHSDIENRTVDLLHEVGLQSHLLDDINDFADFQMFQIQKPEQLRNRIDKLKKSSTEFLVKSLGLSDQYDIVKCPTQIRKDQCYGCYACKEICKTNAISMIEDREGFFYPVVDESKCTNCGLCKKVCIRKHSNIVEFEEKYPKALCAYHNDNDIRKMSSSGGIFPALVKYVIEEKKGAVVGVRYDENMKVVSDIADSIEGTKAFGGSKYVKSSFEDIFPKVKELLKEGQFVLYSGLPCECAGLRSYLRKDHEKLIICELVCHAAPSPKVFHQYVQFLNKKYASKVADLTFRNKEKGWTIGDSGVKVKFANGKVVEERTAENHYYKAFVNDYITRPVCANCRYTFNNRVGDLTIGDCWGIKTAAPELFDNKGVSLLLLNNKKGEAVWNIIADQFEYKESNLKAVFIKNHKKPTQEKRKRIAFFRELDQEPIENLLSKYNNE